MDVDGESVQSSSVSRTKQTGPSIVIETISETFLISAQANADADDKENMVNGALDHASLPRFTVSLVRTTTIIPDPLSPPEVKMSDELAGMSEQSKTDNSVHGDLPASQIEKNASPVAPTETPSIVKARGEGKNATTGPGERIVAEDASPIEGKPAESVSSDAPQSTTGSDSAPKTKTHSAAAEPKATGEEASQPISYQVAEPSKTLTAKHETSAPAPPASEDSKPDIPVDPTLQLDAPRHKNSTNGVPAGLEATKVTSNVPRKSTEKRVVKTLEVLQRNLGQDDITFDTEGINILSSHIENGLRKGWKMEAKSWRWASDELIV